MCEDAATEGQVIPALESFNKLWHLPKTYYIFYEYLYKPVLGHANRRRRIAKGERLGPVMAEMFAIALLNNHYFALLFEFKEASPDVTLVTEYQDDAKIEVEMKVESSHSKTEKAMLGPYLFRGVLDEIEVSMPMQNEASSSTTCATQASQINEATRNGFELLLDVGETVITRQQGSNGS
jgi:hypothetical protein